MTSDVNVSDPAKVEAKNKNFAAGTDAGHCDSSAQGFFLVRLALGHPALLSTKPQPPPALSFNVPKDEEILIATPKPCPQCQWASQPSWHMQQGFISPCRTALPFSPSRREGGGSKAQEDFHAYGYRQPEPWTARDNLISAPLQLPRSSKFC